MRVVILTSSLFGVASVCLPYLMEEPDVDLSMIVYSEGRISNPRKYRRRKLSKVRKIGILGAFNGVRIRSWFEDEVRKTLKVEDLERLARRFDIRFARTPTINSERTVDLFSEVNADLGLSLGNGYIAERVFSSPKHGMINVHHELLPEFRGAQSVIWQVYEGSNKTGFTIHQIDNHTDTGNILYREEMLMELKPTLRESVIHNYGRLYEASAKSLVNVVKNYSDLSAASSNQSGIGRSFTTPTFWQYLRMIRQHRKLYADYRQSANMVTS